ncbi:MAG TPA: hypothetical protein VMV72_05400 [Verrucomicrobiae bacterium]|nr:hypothetical protein [Verrucomicrobiae bacterium]
MTPNRRVFTWLAGLGLALALCAFVWLPAIAGSSIPPWWTSRSVLNTSATPNDFAAVTQGQVKNIASNAWLEMNANLPGGAGATITALVGSFTSTNNYLPANIGQLKYVAKPFYERLIAVGYTTAYPWASGTTTSDYAIANIGQLKNLFAWDLTYSTAGDGIPNWWRLKYFGTLPTNDQTCATCDYTTDQIDNLDKYGYGLDPRAAYPVDVGVNGGNLYVTNRTITLDTSGSPFPFLMVSFSPTMTNAVLLANTGAPVTYTLPSTNNATYYLFLQYADAQTNALGPVLHKPVTLDTIAPWVEITSPTNSVGDQAFIHLQATVFDPDPQNPTAPGSFRPIKVWINGQQYWNLLGGTQIDIPRFSVLPNTNNTITILAQDQAGNQTQAGLNWYVNTSTATNAPTISVIGLTPNTVTDIPNESNVWVSGQVDNLNAIIAATVNGSAPITMSVRSNQFGSLIPVGPGTNVLVLMAYDAAGNAMSETFTLVQGNRYQLAITSPVPFGAFANGQPQIVSGQVSALKDAGLPNQTQVASVTVNGVPTSLSDSGGGTMTFTTTDVVPVLSDGSETALNVVVTWADGSTSTPPPLGWLDGYQITASASWSDWKQSALYDYWDSYPFCIPSPTLAAQGGRQLLANLFTPPHAEGDTNYLGIEDDWYSGSTTDIVTVLPGVDELNWVPADGGWITNYEYAAQPSWNLKFGEMDSWEKTMERDWAFSNMQWKWDGSLTFVAPLSYGASTPVIFTFQNVNYARAPGVPLDLSQVTYQGQHPISWDDGNQTVSYLVFVNGGETYSLNSSSFAWPTGWTSNLTAQADCADIEDYYEKDNWFEFNGFAPTVAMAHVDPSPFNFCAYTTQEFTATGPLDSFGSLCLWSANGGVIVGTSGGRNENAEVYFPSAGPASVTVREAPFSFDGSINATATGTVVDCGQECIQGGWALVRRVNCEINPPGLEGDCPVCLADPISMFPFYFVASSSCGSGTNACCWAEYRQASDPPFDMLTLFVIVKNDGSAAWAAMGTVFDYSFWGCVSCSNPCGIPNYAPISANSISITNKQIVGSFVLQSAWTGHGQGCNWTASIGMDEQPTVYY